MMPAPRYGAQPRGTLRPAPPAGQLPALQSVRLLDRLRERLRLMHYSLRTEEVYVHWCKAFIRFHARKHPAEMGGPEVEAFLTHLAHDRGVAPSTHSQALSALLFLYTKVLGQDLPWLQDVGHPRRHRRLPVVLSPDEVRHVLAGMSGEHLLLAQLLYGTGLRITEALQLRVKDLDFGHRAVIVREGKGGKDRVVMLPLSLVQPLREHLTGVRAVWASDVEAGRSGVELPSALDRKYPRAAHAWSWFWVFPQGQHSTDPRSGVVRRHHLFDETFQRAFKRAVTAAGVPKLASPHTEPGLRPS